MPVIYTDAIILQSFAYSETSKILRVLTPRHGVVSVIARGALRPRSRYGGILEPFTRGAASIHFKPTRELQSLSGFEMTRSGHALGRDLVRFAAASLLCELVLRTTESDAEPAVFQTLERALERLEVASPDAVESEALAQGWLLVGRLGYAPVLTSCISCGRSMGDDEDGSFDHAGGGVRCMRCAGASRGGKALPAAARQALIRLCRGEAVPLARTGAYWRLFASFLGHHVLERGALKSFAVMAGAIEGR